MNIFVLDCLDRIDPSIIVTSTGRLLDTGAEFATFSTKDISMPCKGRFGIMGYASSADFVDGKLKPLYFALRSLILIALECNELSVAILHQSNQELAEALRKCPSLINQANGLAQTPLHLAVGWPYGARALIEHGACVDSTDHDGYTPLYYAILLGVSETVGLLMKADCILQFDPGYSVKNCLWHVSHFDVRRGYEVWGVSQEAYMDVLDTFIRSLAERRHNLQSRLVNLPMAAGINASVFRDDRVLDEYAEYAELAEKDALKEYDYLSPPASTLLAGSRTAYHIYTLTVIFADKLWQNGFRDIDVLDRDSRTPLVLFKLNNCVGLNNMVQEIEICSWLIQKGAKLHRPQQSPLHYGSDRMLSPLKLPPTTMALHDVAANIGWRAHFGEDK